MKNRGHLVILSGFSGSGKGTIVNELLRRYPDEYALSVSATTRNPREGEQDGIHYFFKTQEEFREMIDNNELLEYACYVGNYYGTPKEYVLNKLDEGKNVILEIEVQGAKKIKKQYPETLLLFVTPPTAAELKKRLLGRATETAESVAGRLSQAVTEAEGCETYDYLIINDDLDTCIEEVASIIRMESRRMSSCLETIAKIKQELLEIPKGETL